jgi:histidinol-phosphate aminotransferase
MHSKDGSSMANGLTRRSLLKGAGVAVASEILAGALPAARLAAQPAAPDETIYLNLNENAYGASPRAHLAIERELSRVSRYADSKAANALTEQIAAYERISAEQVILGEILGALGLYFGSQGGPGGEFLYSSPGYLALVDTAARAGGVGVPVPLNAQYQNDLAAFSTRMTASTRLLYLINPHNPTGTVSDDEAFKHFLRESSERAPVIVDEAYLEYTPDFELRSAATASRMRRTWPSSASAADAAAIFRRPSDSASPIPCLRSASATGRGARV